jgi:ABC-type Zn uptake system ZnuABC Zn-binding protein ZnuA
MFWRRLGLYLIPPGFLAVLLGVAGCLTADSPWPSGKHPRVVVTIPALYSFVKNVAGEHGAIRCLCTTTGPHHYEYNVQNNLQLREADLFLAIGLGLDDKFSEKMYEHSQNPKLAKGRTYLRLGDTLASNLKYKMPDHDEDEKDNKDHKDAHHDEHDHGEFDPHVWLGIEQAKNMVDQIRDALSAVDREHDEEYATNAADYKKTLDKLHSDGKKSLEKKESKQIISFHESLQYFAKSFGLTIVDAIERAPGSPPTSGDMAKLKEVCKTKKVHVIAAEPQYASYNAAEQLKKEVGEKITIVEVDPLETADERDLSNPKWYEERMRKNIENLAKALP